MKPATLVYPTASTTRRPASVCLFVFIDTIFSLSPLFISFLFVCYLSQNKKKGASVLNLLLHPYLEASIEDSTKGLVAVEV